MAVQRTEQMARRARNIPAHSQGLESKKNSGGRRGIFLDFTFYRTYQDPSGHSPKGGVLLVRASTYCDRLLNQGDCGKDTDGNERPTRCLRGESSA